MSMGGHVGRITSVIFFVTCWVAAQRVMVG